MFKKDQKLLDPEKDREEILRRIVLLGGAFVGCGQICGCRVALALTLSEEQLKLVDAQANANQFEGPAGGLEELREAFGDSVTELQDEAFRSIGKTPQDPEYVRTRESGGMVAAIESYNQFFAPDPIQLVFMALSGAPTKSH